VLASATDAPCRLRDLYWRQGRRAFFRLRQNSVQLDQVQRLRIKVAEIIGEVVLRESAAKPHGHFSRIWGQIFGPAKARERSLDECRDRHSATHVIRWLHGATVVRALSRRSFGFELHPVNIGQFA